MPLALPVIPANTTLPLATCITGPGAAVTISHYGLVKG